MALTEQLTTVRDERAARDSLRAQIARLERDLSSVVVTGFPHIETSSHGGPAPVPRLLGIEELEKHRDALVARLSDAKAAAAARSRHECRARALLEEMELEPARHKFVRLRETDLGGRGCGVYEVRPRLGLIGMLAGWWRLTLSSGCPLEMGRAVSARPAPPRSCAVSSRAA